MPGQTLKIECTIPSFQVTLKGSGDESGIFETSNEPSKWTMNKLHYALGRMVWDIVFEKGLVMDTPVKIMVEYSTLISKPEPKVQMASWRLVFQPARWIALPKCDGRFHSLSINGLSSEFRLAVAGIPLKVFTTRSKNGVLRFSDIPSAEKRGLLDKDTLSYGEILSAYAIVEGSPPPRGTTLTFSYET
jgi:hypothetical protein